MSKALVINHNLWLKQKDSCKSKPLSFSAGKTASGLINHMINSVWVSGENLRKARFCNSVNNFFISKVMAKQRYVIPDGRVKNKRLLRARDYKPSILLTFELLNWHTIQTNVSVIWTQSIC